MLLTWHNNNIFSNLCLNLNCRLEEKTFIKKITTYIYQIYNNRLLKLKNMDRSVVCASICIHFFVFILFEIYYSDSIYDMLKQKEHVWKKIARKKLWTFDKLKMSHIFISPYHNHFWVDFNFYFLNMHIKELFRMSYFHMGF